MPLPITARPPLVRRLAEARRKGDLDFLRPDGKCQVTVEYDGGRPIRVEAVVVSTQHAEADQRTTSLQRSDHRGGHPARSFRPSSWTAETQVPHQPDRPLRDRRTAGRHGPDRPEDHRRHLRRDGPRTAAARSPARTPRRSTVPRPTWPDTSRRTSSRPASPTGCEVQLAYAIGVAEPVSRPRRNRTAPARSRSARIVELVREHFALTPARDHRDARPAPADLQEDRGVRPLRPRGPEFTWERPDRAEELSSAAGVEGGHAVVR